MKHISSLVIGGSAGSLDVILNLLAQLNNPLPIAIIIVVHRKSNSDSALTDLLTSRTKIPVREVEEKDVISAGHIYIAPADYHLLVEKDFSFSLDFSEKVNYSRPSIDVTFQSVAETYTRNTVCLLLSGANNDGTEGLQFVKSLGGVTAVQDPDSALVPFMPQHALSNMKVDYVLKSDEMADFVNRLGI